MDQWAFIKELDDGALWAIRAALHIAFGIDVDGGKTLFGKVSSELYRRQQIQHTLVMKVRDSK